MTSSQKILNDIISGNLIAIQQTNPHEFTHDHTEIAIKYGNLDILKHLIKSGISITEMMLRLAVRYHQIPIIEWIYQNAHPDFILCEYNNPSDEIVEWFIHHQPHACDCSVVVLAVKQGLPLIKKCSDAGLKFTVRVIDYASELGMLDVVKYLHVNRTDGCTRNAINLAAKNGHFEVVKWLSQHRNEGCDSEAIDGAAGNGHFEIVKWLWVHYNISCTEFAFTEATANGHFEIVQWLSTIFEETGKQCDIVPIAAENGHLEIVKWACENMPVNDVSISNAMFSGARNGHLNIVMYLVNRFTNPQLFKVIKKAQYHGYLEIVNYLEMYILSNNNNNIIYS